MNREEQLTLRNDIRELHKLTELLEQVGERWSIAPNIMMAVNLCLEEAVSNIIFYAFEDSKEHLFEINLRWSEKQLCMVLIDDGKPFDPVKSKDPDTSLSLEERPIGGLGIHLMKNLMDSIAYERIENKNHLTLIKNLI